MAVINYYQLREDSCSTDSKNAMFVEMCLKQLIVSLFEPDNNFFCVNKFIVTVIASKDQKFLPSIKYPIIGHQTLS
jgi:hypothetical protein